MLRVLDLFSGIGGFSLGLERAGGFETAAFCEIEPYCQKVLRKHWPDVPIFDDVKELTGEQVGSVDVICGGFPCQDISVAGKGAGLAGERSGLWGEIARLTGELRPRYVIVENVSALLGRGLGTVLGDLAALGYDAEWNCIPASAVGAPHRRDRIWIVAYPSSVRRKRNTSVTGSDEEKKITRRLREFERSGEDVADTSNTGLQGGKNTGKVSGSGPWPDEQSPGCNGSRWGGQWLTEPDVGRVAHGVPARVDRLKSLGNAVVPQIPEMIGRAIMAAEKSEKE